MSMDGSSFSTNESNMCLLINHSILDTYCTKDPDVRDQLGDFITTNLYAIFLQYYSVIMKIT